MVTMFDLNKRAKTGEQVEGFKNQLNNQSQQIIQIMERLRKTKEDMETQPGIFSTDDVNEVKKIYNNTLDFLNSTLESYNRL